MKSRIWQKNKQKRILLRKLISLAIIIFLFKLFRQSWNASRPVEDAKELNDNGDRWGEVDSLVGYHVRTNACVIPEFKINLQDVGGGKGTWANCRNWKNFVEFEDLAETIVSLTPEYQSQNCSIRQIARGRLSDKKCNIQPAQPFSKTCDVTNMDFFGVNCHEEFQFGARIPVSTTVQSKMAYWRKLYTSQPDKPLPFNVLVIGIASTSRAHFHRSLPKTAQSLRQFKFFDFQGYHSLSRKPFLDFMTMLTGMSASSFRSSLQGLTLDARPFIWKYFDTNEYVTMYNDDSDWLYSNFHGFRFQPVDYYLHPLYAAQNAWTKDSNRIQIDESKKICVSSDSIPQFSLKYLRRFLDKFFEVPFVSFNLLSNPFTTDFNALSQLDEDFSSLIRHVGSSKDHMQRTLIILTSDQGYRDSYPFVYTSGGAAERSLPALFIRIPDSISNHYSQSRSIMYSNSRRLTTAYDLHYTILHTLSVHFPDYFGDNFSKFASSGVPLYNQTVLVERKCDGSTGAGCACNMDVGDGTATAFDITKDRESLEEFVLSDLNHFYDLKVYCFKRETWELHPTRPLLGIERLRGNETSTKILLFFKLDNSAEFQTTIWIHNHNNSTNYSRVGPFLRLDNNNVRLCQYGDT